MHPRFVLLLSFLCFAQLTVPAAGGEPPRLDDYGDPLPPGVVFRIGTTRLRHEKTWDIPSFGNVLLTPDGKYVLSSAEGEFVVRTWEIATGREGRLYPGRRFAPDFVLSADASLLAVSEPSEINLYDLATGKKQRTIDTSPSEKVIAQQCSTTFSRDGKILTTFHYEAGDGTHYLRRWETATGKNIENWKMDADQPLALSPDGKLVLSIEEKEDAPKKNAKLENPNLWERVQAKTIKISTIRLWDRTNRRMIWERKAAARVPWEYRCLIFSPDGRNIVSAGEDGMIRVQETANGKEVRSWKARTPNERSGAANKVDVGWLVFTPDGKTLASVDRNYVCCLWDWKSGRELRRFNKVLGPVAFSADGKTLAAADADSRIRLWDTATGKDLCPFVDPGGISAIAFSPDGRRIAAGTDRSMTHLRDARGGQLLKSYLGYDLVSFSPDGASLLAKRQDESLRLLDAATGKERIDFRDSQKDWYLGGWSADKKLLLMKNHAGVRIWDITTGKIRCEIRRPQQSKGGNTALCCSPDGRTVAVADFEASRIRLFAADSGKELRQLTGCCPTMKCRYYRGNETRVSVSTYLWPIYSADARFLIVGCDEKSFGLWDTVSGKIAQRWNCGELLPLGASFSPDGQWLALHDTNLNLCLVNPATGRVRHRLPRKDEYGNWLLDASKRAFSEDGRLLAVAYNPHTIVLWETATGRPIRTWPGHSRGELVQMEFSADARCLATVSTDRTALVWDVMGLSPDGQLPARKLTVAQTKQAWNDLADADAAKAHRALWSLVADPARALPLLREHVHPTTRIDPHRIAQRIADLDSNEFAAREAATRQLREMGELAETALRTALKDKPSLELRRRVERLLEQLDSADLPAETLRALRAVAVLEQIGNDEARQLLGVLADGAPSSRLTHEAKASLARLHSRRFQP